MVKKTFKTEDELRQYLNECGLDNTKFCVRPDYIDAIIGIGDDGKVVYDYDKMVEYLAKEYSKEPDCEDPYTDAMEWIDYNCDIPYWHIIYVRDKDEWVCEYDDEDLEKAIEPYKEMVIGPDTYGHLCFDSEKMTESDVEKVKEIMDVSDYGFNII